MGDLPGFQTCPEMTILTASRILQGSEIRVALDMSFADLYHDLDKGFTPIGLIPPNLPLPSSRRRDVAQKAMTDFYVHIQKRVVERDGQFVRLVGGPSFLARSQDEHDTMAVLCGQKYKDGRAVTDWEVAHMLTALLMAGQHTCSSSIAWTVIKSGQQPHRCVRFTTRLLSSTVHDIFSEALYEEQRKLFCNHDGSLRSRNTKKRRNSLFQTASSVKLCDTVRPSARSW